MENVTLSPVIVGTIEHLCKNPNTNRRIIQVVRAQEGQNLGREVWSKKEEEAEGRCFDAHRRERGC